MKKYCTLYIVQILSFFALSCCLPRVGFSQCTNTTIIDLTSGGTTSWQNTNGTAVTVKITCIGADGGAGKFAAGDNLGGTGATTIAIYTVQANEWLHAYAGTAGTSGTPSPGGGGGGGGSGVVNCGTSNNCSSGTILVAAGGGGGGGIQDAAANKKGKGGLITIGDMEGGTKTQSNNNSGAGGGGLNSSGQNSNAGGGVQIDKSSLSSGGNGAGNGGDGGDGFGGGGGAANGGGGGGGYSGGDTGIGGFVVGGEGGYSFDNGTESDTPGTNGGATNPGTDGKVTVICLALLPVELVDFQAKLHENKEVLLNWHTSSELNNFGFEIQRSADGKTWDDLAFVPGHGTTQEEQSYSYTDERPLPGVNYYRLRQMDFDGGEEYSKVVSVEVGFASKALTFFPNPAPGGITSFYLPETPEGEGMLEVFDCLGNKVHRQAILLEGGSEVLVPLDLHSFPSGTYVAALQIGGKVFSEKLMLKQ